MVGQSKAFRQNHRTTTTTTTTTWYPPFHHNKRHRIDGKLCERPTGGNNNSQKSCAIYQAAGSEFVRLMEMNKDLKLKALVQRARDLEDGLSDEINNSTTFCRFRSEIGRYNGGIAAAKSPSFQERQRLIAIRDSLKEVGDSLLLLQRLKTWQPIDRRAALNRLEESRLGLVEKANHYQGRPLGVMKDLNACFNNGKTAFDWNLNHKMKNKAVDEPYLQNRKRRLTAGSLVSCVRMLFDPWKWQKAVRVVARLIVVSASISSAVNLYHARDQQSSQQRELLSNGESSNAQTGITAIRSFTKSSAFLDVSYGKG